MASTGIAALDELTGGWPRGCVSEICGRASSGRTGVLLAALARSTRNGEVCALVDAGDALDPTSAEAAGVDLQRLLWVRCGKEKVLSSQFTVLSSRGKQKDGGNLDGQKIATERRDWNWRLEQVLRVTDLLLQSNGFGMIALDLGDVPVRSARQIPLASWFRFRRVIERTPTVLLVVEQQPIAGSCSSLLIQVSGVRSQVSGKKFSAASSPHAELFDKFEVTVKLLHSRLNRKPMQSAIAWFESRSAWAS
jgi:hypothetical protein